MSLNFNNPDTFPPEDSQSGPPKQGENPGDHGYPQKWTKKAPHWHSEEGKEEYNPHLYCFLNQPDGTRAYYDPVCGTHSLEHFSGTHIAVLKDAYVHTVPNKRVDFTGGGGYSEGHGGYHDYSNQAGRRENVKGDTYSNVQGSRHTFTGGSHADIQIGNKQTMFAGNYHMRGYGEKAGFGISMGQGGSPQNAGIGITKNRITISQNGQGDSQAGVWYKTADSNIALESGKHIGITSKEDITIHANGQKIVVKGSKVYITGNVMLQGDLQVSGKVQASDIVSPVSHITDMWSTTGHTGSGSAPNLNNPSPAALDLAAGKVGTFTYS